MEMDASTMKEQRECLITPCTTASKRDQRCYNCSLQTVKQVLFNAITMNTEEKSQRPRFMEALLKFLRQQSNIPEVIDGNS